ncbi:MAG: T9SS type A sorting domain-containing protein, partial [Bacteroidales bacterium]|nr:T9SS type A sorting domain-containing protein [Bacteroidales bacterium]
VEIHLKDKKLCTGWNSGAAILGLHNYNGTIAQVPAGHNYPATWSAHNEAWKFACNCVGCVVPLPIELISFEGSCYQNNIELTWETASEENNQHFTIEKSTDAINFAAIGTVEGAGNSNKSHNYSFMDKNNGYDKVYYRLKQTDFDGTSETTRPIAVACNSFTNNILISPNPAKANEPITVFGNFKTLKVKSVLGSYIKAKIEGNKILGLPKGVYFIIIDEYYTSKIVVQ